MKKIITIFTIIALVNILGFYIYKNLNESSSLGEQGLLNKEWQWIKTVYNSGKTTLPNKPGLFTVTFFNNGQANLKTDCNGMSAKFKFNSSSLNFNLEESISTMMFCENSQTSEFIEALTKITDYTLNNQNELVLKTGTNELKMIFQ